SRDWLTFVKSPRAKSKIKQWFTKERREEAIEKGKDSLAKTLRKQGLPLQRLMSHESLTEVATRMNHADIDALYAAIGDGHVSTEAVMRSLVKAHGGAEAAT
ncbi:RelA/SpoT AH/RIS domain-containing protein, partial [Salmonella enterica]|uniref:RelA/SpoT AH/RIS domain-containing protein n=1 Tax=Salmonella enterica TaxID=28901 RepID=UPI001654BD03